MALPLGESPKCYGFYPSFLALFYQKFPLLASVFRAFFKISQKTPYYSFFRAHAYFILLTKGVTMYIITKTIHLNDAPRGICCALGVSLKTGLIKYLYCKTDDGAEFAINATALTSVTPFSLLCSTLRPVIPKNAVKLFLGQPVYASTGKFLGNLTAVKQDCLRVLSLTTSQKCTFPLQCVGACNDAIILRKQLPYPLGQRVHTPTKQCVTRPLLRTAIAQNELIQFTLSLAPFHLR